MPAETPAELREKLKTAKINEAQDRIDVHSVALKDAEITVKAIKKALARANADLRKAQTEDAQ